MRPELDEGHGQVRALWSRLPAEARERPVLFEALLESREPGVRNLVGQA
jgi:hypothetical protein